MKRYAAFTLSALMLSACGGGGGGSSSSSPAPAPAPATSTKFAVSSTYGTLFQTGRQFTLGTLINQVPVTFTWTFTPGNPASFMGQIDLTATQTLSASVQGTTITQSSTLYYSLSPTTVYGGVDSNGNLNVYASPAVLPTAASVGDSGSLPALTTYSDASQTMVVSTATNSWSILPGPTGSAYFCMNSATTATGSSMASPESDCLQIDTSGNILAARVTVMINGQTYILQ